MNTKPELILSLSRGRVRCRQAGDGAPLLLVHGVGLNAAAWEPQFEAFSPAYRVIAVDLPGHGASDRLPQGSLLPDYVDWLDEVVAALDCGPASVAGHSMGALVAAGLAIDRPARVDRVALLNGVGRRSPAARAAVLARADELAAGTMDTRAPLRRWFGDDPRWLTLRERTGQWLQGCPREGYAAAYRAFALGDDVYDRRMAEIACPALFLTGAEDANSTPAMARRMAAAAGGSCVVIEGHAHMAPLTAPGAVNRALGRWLQAPAPARREAS